MQINRELLPAIHQRNTPLLNTSFVSLHCIKHQVVARHSYALAPATTVFHGVHFVRHLEFV